MRIVRYQSGNSSLIRERIIRLQAELRRARIELRLAEAEERDRERLFPQECRRQAGAESARRQDARKKAQAGHLGDCETGDNDHENNTTT